jgi:hypothetical protein
MATFADGIAARTARATRLVKARGVSVSARNAGGKHQGGNDRRQQLHDSHLA